MDEKIKIMIAVLIVGTVSVGCIENTENSSSIKLILKDEYALGEDINTQVENLLGVDVYTFGCDGGCNDFEVFDVEGKRAFPASCARDCDRDNTLIESGETETIGVWNQKYDIYPESEQVGPGTYEIRVNYVDSNLVRRYVNEIDDGKEIDGVLVKRIKISEEQ